MLPGRPRSKRILLDAVDHLHRCRSYELARLIAKTRPYFAPPILEIGSGDGFQCRILSEQFGRVVATEVDASRFQGAGMPIVQCTSEALPFARGVFKTIFSSSVLEHVPDIDRALLDMKRVLAPGGFMVHVVPTRFWQVLALGLRLPYMVGRSLYQLAAEQVHALTGAGYSKEAWRDWWYSGTDVRRENLFMVPPHGISATHLEEWHVWALARWVERFRKARLRVVRVIDLYTYSPYGFLAGEERWRVALADMGLPGVRAFVLEHA